MIRLSSFRGRLAARFGATVMLMGIVSTALGYFALQRILYRHVDKNLLRLAEIEAAATADSPDGSVHFHEELFTEGPNDAAVTTGYAEVWTLRGEPVARTKNLEDRDLPLPDDVRRSVASTGKPELFSFRWQGRSYRGLVYPLVLIGVEHRDHLLEVVAPREEADAVLSHFLRVLSLILLFGTAAACVLGWWLAGHAVRPVTEIIRQAESIDMSSAPHRLSAKTETDELSRLVSVLNTMLARIDTAFQNQRRFLADAGHEIKTPLTILRGDVEVALRRQRPASEYRTVLEQALEDLKEVSSLAEGLITLARSDSEGLEPGRANVSVQELLRKVQSRYSKAALIAGVKLNVDVDGALFVKGDAGFLERALSNLVDNAIKYGRGGGEVSLSASPAQASMVLIEVTDRGPGIPESERVHVFERFYRGEMARRSTRGSGLGLAIVKAIIESHDGQIRLQSETGHRTTLSLVLPAAAPRTQGSSTDERVASAGQLQP